jgi:hypothetical protein
MVYITLHPRTQAFSSRLLVRQEETLIMEAVKCLWMISLGFLDQPPSLKNLNDLSLELKLNSVALASEQTIATERPPLVGDVSASYCG